MKDGGGQDRTDGSMQALSTICAIYMCFFIVATAVIARRLQPEIAQKSQSAHTQAHQLYLACTARWLLQKPFFLSTLRDFWPGQFYIPGVTSSGFLTCLSEYKFTGIGDIFKGAALRLATFRVHVLFTQLRCKHSRHKPCLRMTFLLRQCRHLRHSAPMFCSHVTHG